MEIVIFLIILILLWWPIDKAVSYLVDCSTKGIDLRSPPGVPNQWEEVIRVGGGGGKWIGRMERILIFTVLFWGGEKGYITIGGYLGFKVASKWAAWQHIVRVPESLPGVSLLSYLQARKAWGTLMLTRFLVGTLANILVGFLGFVVGKDGIAIIKFLCGYLS